MAGGKVRRSPKWWWFILWATWTCVQNFMAIDLIVVEILQSGLEQRTDQHHHARSRSVSKAHNFECVLSVFAEIRAAQQILVFLMQLLNLYDVNQQSAPVHQCHPNTSSTSPPYFAFNAIPSCLRLRRKHKHVANAKWFNLRLERTHILSHGVTVQRTQNPLCFLV